jgi:hypothetical protein
LVGASSSSSKAISKTIEVLRGEQNVASTVLQFTSKADNRTDSGVDNTRQSLVVNIEIVRKAEYGMRVIHMEKETQHLHSEYRSLVFHYNE